MKQTERTGLKMQTELPALRKKAETILNQAEKEGIITQDQLFRSLGELELTGSFDEIDRILDPILNKPEPGRSVSLPVETVKVLAIMAEVEKKSVELGTSTSVLTCMAECVLDYRDVNVSQEILLDTRTIMGETRVYLTRGTPVEVRATPIMGAVTRDRDLVLSRSGPRLIILGKILMGELKILYR